LLSVRSPFSGCRYSATTATASTRP
jgi:hypothetical protein